MDDIKYISSKTFSTDTKLATAIQEKIPRKDSKQSDYKTSS